MFVTSLSVPGQHLKCASKVGRTQDYVIKYGLPFSDLKWPVTLVATGSVTVYSWLSVPTVIIDEQLPL